MKSSEHQVVCTGSGKVIETGFEHETAILRHRQFILFAGHCCCCCLFCLDSEENVTTKLNACPLHSYEHLLSQLLER